MVTREIIIQELAAIFEEDGYSVPDLVDDLVLLDSDLDSLGFAVLVTRLDERLGYDPFALMDEPVYPASLGQFIELYERFQA